MRSLCPHVPPVSLPRAELSAQDHKAVHAENTHNFIQQHIEQDAVAELALLEHALEVTDAKKKAVQKKIEKKKQKAAVAAAVAVTAGEAKAQ